MSGPIIPKGYAPTRRPNQETAGSYAANGLEGAVSREATELAPAPTRVSGINPTGAPRTNPCDPMVALAPGQNEMNGAQIQRLRQTRGDEMNPTVVAVGEGDVRQLLDNPASSPTAGAAYAGRARDGAWPRREMLAAYRELFDKDKHPEFVALSPRELSARIMFIVAQSNGLGADSFRDAKSVYLMSSEQMAMVLADLDGEFTGMHRDLDGLWAADRPIEADPAAGLWAWIQQNADEWYGWQSDVYQGDWTPPIVDPGKGDSIRELDLNRLRLEQAAYNDADDRRRRDATSVDVNKNVQQFHEKLEAIRDDRIRYAEVIVQLNRIHAQWAKQDPETRGSLVDAFNGPTGPFTTDTLRGTWLPR